MKLPNPLSPYSDAFKIGLFAIIIIGAVMFGFWVHHVMHHDKTEAGLSEAYEQKLDEALKPILYAQEAHVQAINTTTDAVKQLESRNNDLVTLAKANDINTRQLQGYITEMLRIASETKGQAVLSKDSVWHFADTTGLRKFFLSLNQNTGQVVITDTLEGKFTGIFYHKRKHKFLWFRIGAWSDSLVLRSNNPLIQIGEVDFVKGY